MRRPRSLQARLLLLLLLIVPLIWLVASATAAWLAHEEVDELFDTQMGQFARQLLLVEVSENSWSICPSSSTCSSTRTRGRWTMTISAWRCGTATAICYSATAVAAVSIMNRNGAASTIIAARTAITTGG